MITGGNSGDLTKAQLELAGVKTMIADGELVPSGVALPDPVAPPTPPEDGATVIVDLTQLSDEEVAALSPAVKRKRTMALNKLAANSLPPVS